VSVAFLYSLSPFYPFDSIRHSVWGLTYVVGAAFLGGVCAAWSRHSYRPIDAIPRASVTWEAGGGWRSSVGDGEGGRFLLMMCIFLPRREVNLRLSHSHPDQRHNFDTRPRGPKLKCLGDPPTSPAVASQNMGTFAREGTASEIEAFVKLARGYVFGGPDRRAVCAVNADVSSFPLLHFLHVELMVCLHL
jgi:hypothetical protein